MRGYCGSVFAGVLGVGIGSGLALPVGAQDCAMAAFLPIEEAAPCLIERAAFWNRVLDEVYLRLAETSEPARADAIRAAQEFWLDYRAAHCAVAAADAESHGAAVEAGCQAGLTEARVAELQALMGR